MDEKDKPRDGSTEPAGTLRELKPFKVLLLFVVALGALYYVAGDPRHGGSTPAVAFRTSLEQAAGEARQAGKVIFADFYADWCGPCRALDREVFSRKDFAADLERVAVPLRVDIQTREGAALAGRYHVEYIPTCIVLGPDGQVLGRSGGATAEALLALVRRAAARAGRDGKGAG